MTVSNIQSLVAAVQLSLAAGTPLPEGQIHVDVYQGQPDLEVLDAIDKHYQDKTPLPDYEKDSFMAFIFSKPILENGQVGIHAFLPSAASGQLNGELWIKMKSRAALLASYGLDSGPSEARFNVQQLQQTLLIEAEISDNDLSVTYEQMGSGPEWIRSPLTISDDQTMKFIVPVVETPLDVPERFAGHFYVKLLMPERF